MKLFSKFAGVAAVTFLAACAGARPEYPSSSSPGVRLELVTLRPGETAGLTRDSVLEAVLRYQVDPVAYPGPYSVEVMFGSGVGAYFRPATPDERRANGPSSEWHADPAGEVVIRYPLSELLDVQGLAQPMQLMFILGHRHEPVGDPAPGARGPAQARAVSITELRFEYPPS